MICRIDKNIKKGCSPYVLPDVREIYLLNYSDFDGYDVDNCEYCVNWKEGSKWYRIDVENASFSDSLAIGNNQNKYRNVSLTFSLYNSKDACVEEAYNAIVLGKYVAVFYANGVWYVSGLLNGMTVNESASDSESHTITLEENTTLTSQILNAECAQDVVDSANGEEPTPPEPPTPPSPYDDIVASFEVTSTENVTKILGLPESVIDRYIGNQRIDNVLQETIHGNYLFDSLGAHEVRYKYLNNYSYSLFDGCKDLVSVSFPEIVTTIEASNFDGCTNLYAVSIPSSVNDIRLPNSNVGLFKNSGDISFIVVDEDNQTYDSRNFCNAIIETSSNILIVGGKDTIIPNTVVSIGDGAFYGRTGLTSIMIPDSVTSIGRNAFSHCSGLTNITIPNSVTSIDNSAFTDCTGLTSITIGNGITSIGNNAFNSCTSLTSITVEATTPPALDAVSAFNNTNDCPIYVPCQSVEAYKTATNWSRLASRITCVQPVSGDLIGTFNVTSTSNYTYLTGYNRTSYFSSMEIDSVVQQDVYYRYRFPTTGEHTVKYTLVDNTTIGEYAFNGCVNMIDVNIPNTITTIGGNAFSACSALETITIPNNVITISNNAYNTCSGLTSAIIGSGVTTIGANAFSACRNLTSITVLATTPPTLGDVNAFADTNNCPIYVPSASVTAYQTATNWSNYASRINPIT